MEEIKNKTKQNKTNKNMLVKTKKNSLQISTEQKFKEVRVLFPIEISLNV